MPTAATLIAAVGMLSVPRLWGHECTAFTRLGDVEAGLNAFAGAPLGWAGDKRLEGTRSGPDDGGSVNRFPNARGSPELEKHRRSRVSCG